MKRLLFGSILAGFALFVYGFLSFAVLSWHDPKPLKDDRPLAAAIQASVTEPGMYMVPSQVRPDGSHLGEDEWMAASSKGPYMLAMIRPGENRRPMVSYMAASLVWNICLAFLLGLILRSTGASYCGMLCLGAAIGLFAALSSWLPASNWYEYPLRYWAPYVPDQVIQGTLVAAIVGRFLRAKPCGSAGPAPTQDGFSRADRSI